MRSLQLFEICFISFFFFLQLLFTNFYITKSWFWRQILEPEAFLVPHSLKFWFRRKTHRFAIFFHFYSYQYKISIPLSRIHAAKRMKIIFILSMGSGSEAEPEFGWAVGEKEKKRWRAMGWERTGMRMFAREGEALL